VVSFLADMGSIIKRYKAGEITKEQMKQELAKLYVPGYKAPAPPPKPKPKTPLQRYKTGEITKEQLKHELSKIYVPGYDKPEPKPRVWKRLPTYTDIYKDIGGSQLQVMKYLRQPGLTMKQRREAIKIMLTLRRQRAEVKKLEEAHYFVGVDPMGEYQFTPTEKTIKAIKTKELDIQTTRIRGLYDKPSVAGFAHTWTTGILSWEDPLSLKSLYYTIRGEREKVIETKARASLDLDKALKAGLPSYVFKVSTGPFATVGISYGIGTGVGTGVGALKVAYPTIGKITQVGMGVGFGALAVKEAYPTVKKAIRTGEYGELFGTAGMMGFTSLAGMSGYKRGSIFGAGRTRESLYLRHTYKRGSVLDIRARQALKIARRLEVVKSHKLEALDLSKDIMRMNRRTAIRTMQYLEKHPKTTIGGSAASYAQIEKFRMPRDLDLLLKGGDKDVSAAKRFFGKSLLKTKDGQHRIDIHGKEFFKPMEHHEFGFISKTPVKIKLYRYMKAGEQLFRKAISSVKKETRYRHFKDVPDFITHAKSLTKSAKMKWYTRWRGTSAEKQLQYFLHPKTHPRFGKADTRLSKFITHITKKPEAVGRVIIPSDTGIALSYPKYPKYMYPRGYLGGTIGTYLYPTKKYKPTQYIAPFKIKPITIPMISKKEIKPSYIKPVKIKTPKYLLTKYPPYKPGKPIITIYPPIKKEEEEEKQRRRKKKPEPTKKPKKLIMPPEFYGKYRKREFKMKYILEPIKLRGMKR
jgi:hypothetical protein